MVTRVSRRWKGIFFSFKNSVKFRIFPNFRDLQRNLKKKKLIVEQLSAYAHEQLGI